MILVTGAAGKTGQAVIRHLVARGASVRALVRRSEQIPDLQNLGAVEFVIGDLGDSQALQTATEQVKSLYFIAPNVHPDEFHFARSLMETAAQNKLRHFVYHSVLHPQVEAMPHHWKKMRVEEALFASGLDYTILQPCAYMQNTLAMWETMLTEGVYRVPHATHACLNLVDLEDVAEVAAIVLTQPGHTAAVYELAGPHCLNAEDIAATVSKSIGRHVAAKQQAIPEWESAAYARGLSGYAIETLTAMFRYYDQHGLRGNPGVLGWLLGRPPRTYQEFIDRHIGN
jgi:uncharacterized protein YbjT (DUF2867 family)